MIPNRSQFRETKLPARESGFSQPELQEEIKTTFRKLSDLLEQDAPTWYSDQLREKTESVRGHIGEVSMSLQCGRCSSLANYLGMMPPFLPPGSNL